LNDVARRTIYLKVRKQRHRGPFKRIYENNDSSLSATDGDFSVFRKIRRHPRTGSPNRPVVERTDGIGKRGVHPRPGCAESDRIISGPVFVRGWQIPRLRPVGVYNTRRSGRYVYPVRPVVDGINVATVSVPRQLSGRRRRRLRGLFKNGTRRGTR